MLNMHILPTVLFSESMRIFAKIKRIANASCFPILAYLVMM